MATINQELDKDAIELICADYGVEVEEEIRIDITDLEVFFESDEENQRIQKNVHQLLQLWDTLTMVKQLYLTLFVIQK